MLFPNIFLAGDGSGVTEQALEPVLFLVWTALRCLRPRWKSGYWKQVLWAKGLQA